MNEEYYIGFRGKSTVTNDTIAQIVNDYVNGDFDSFDDLVYRFGIQENELREIIEEVLSTKPINKPRIIYRKSKI